MNRIATTITSCTLGLFLVASCTDPEPDDDGPSTTEDSGAVSDSGTSTTDGGSADGGSDTGWTEEEATQACLDAAHEGAGDAVSELKDCECVEEEIYASWSMDEYDTQLEQYCYWNPWMEQFLQYCQENCPQTEEFVTCCDKVDAWARKRRPDEPEWSPI